MSKLSRGLTLPDHFFLFVLLFCLLVFILACTKPEKPQPTQEWFDQHTRQLVDQVVSACIASHHQFVTRGGPVDCRAVVPRSLHLSLPSEAFYERHAGGLGQFVQSWCGAIGSRYGANVSYTLLFRQEKKQISRKCHSPELKES